MDEPQGQKKAAEAASATFASYERLHKRSWLHLAGFYVSCPFPGRIWCTVFWPAWRRVAFTASTKSYGTHITPLSTKGIWGFLRWRSGAVWQVSAITSSAGGWLFLVFVPRFRGRFVFV